MPRPHSPSFVGYLSVRAAGEGEATTHGKGGDHHHAGNRRHRDTSLNRAVARLNGLGSCTKTGDRLGEDLQRVVVERADRVHDEVGTRSEIDGNWMYRMAAVVLGIYGNSAVEAFYPQGGGPSKSVYVMMFAIYEKAIQQNLMGIVAAITVIFLAFVMCITVAQRWLIEKRTHYS